jgi:hypothetical protein
MNRFTFALLSLTSLALISQAAPPRGTGHSGGRNFAPSGGSHAVGHKPVQVGSTGFKPINHTASPIVHQPTVHKPIVPHPVVHKPIATVPHHGVKPIVHGVHHGVKPIAHGGIVKPTVAAHLIHKPTFAYTKAHGVKFGGGFFYRGLAHRHWTQCYYWGAHRAWCYWCPSSCCWYYWQATHGCFYPVSYIQTLPPVVVTAAPVPGIPVAPAAVDPLAESVPQVP